VVRVVAVLGERRAGLYAAFDPRVRRGRARVGRDVVRGLRARSRDLVVHGLRELRLYVVGRAPSVTRLTDRAVAVAASPTARRIGAHGLQAREARPGSLRVAVSDPRTDGRSVVAARRRDRDLREVPIFPAPAGARRRRAAFAP